jgi:hypothetical protein
MLYGTHRTIEGIKKMIWGYTVTLVLAGCLSAAAQTPAQTPAPAPTDPSSQSKPATTPQAPQQKPQAPGQTAPAVSPPANSNAFPDDTSNVPVVSTNPAAADRVANGDEGRSMALPGADYDPVRSPDDAAEPEDVTGANSSSSSSGMDKLLPASGGDVPDRKRKLGSKEPTHVEAATEDISVGEYYLERKNWRAALSRFESAMVLAPDNPDVFWGLAEADRHLGDFAAARKYYQTVVDYDPDSRHGKDARKALKEPEIANAKATPPAAPGAK